MLWPGRNVAAFYFFDMEFFDRNAVQQ